jgi:hypothetical protein
LLLAIDAQYHRHEFLEELRAAVFLALGIETERGWQITVAPRTKIEWRSDPPEGTVEIRSSG